MGAKLDLRVMHILTNYSYLTLSSFSTIYMKSVGNA